MVALWELLWWGCRSITYGGSTVKVAHIFGVYPDLWSTVEPVLPCVCAVESECEASVSCAEYVVPDDETSVSLLMMVLFASVRLMIDLWWVCRASASTCHVVAALPFDTCRV